ncbi:hypothetical protein GobsT_22950 [Gemmata obscuriglobus]|uniref:DUF4328 domain-containing protein n=1 Tax=Gemmata obscuriglobus TaxID=114 RepID=A0A2Z3H6Y7_9BACT|nr:hypothetical protein [Gemmata obscuriglobus]AWM39387.1 hypothetical protein C1280_21970 [Gemmata obscuriglobus]QEG27539.1 hypothetical protein GobsT_22950 [Gemmata obscuriglobus]VTS04597.1 Uncharacterized protein OS=mine drainage metagenome GN=B1B_05675 PE=4 SV=1 [Gemmata obscuriglobus UQM 2246]
MSPPTLLAQNNGPDAIVVAVIAGVCGFYLLLFVASIFYLLTLSRALAQCHPLNRTMEPAMVWLNLIPFFNLVWIFITIIRVTETLRDEHRERGWHRRGEDYGQTLGIVASALGALSLVLGYCGLPAFVGGLVCWILYWVKVSNLSRRLELRYRDDDYDTDASDDYDDDYDDGRNGRGRSPRRRNVDEDDNEDDDGRHPPGNRW